MRHPPPGGGDCSGPLPIGMKVDKMDHLHITDHHCFKDHPHHRRAVYAMPTRISWTTRAS